MRILILALLLSGCESVPYVTGPHLSRVCVTVHWVPEADIAAVCDGKEACATINKREGSEAKIWAVKPDSFTDSYRVLVLGHEFLHNLGATHK